MGGHDLETAEQSRLFNLVDEAFLRLQTNDRLRLGSGDILLIPGNNVPHNSTAFRRSGSFYVLSPNANRSSYLIIHHDWVKERNHPYECSFDSWEIDPALGQVIVRGRYSERFDQPLTDHFAIITKAKDNRGKKDLSTQPCWELLNYLAHEAGLGNAVYDLAAYHGSDADFTPGGAPI